MFLLNRSHDANIIDPLAVTKNEGLSERVGKVSERVGITDITFQTISSVNQASSTVAGL